MVDQIVVDRSKETVNPTLEEQAANMGIDPSKIDPEAQSQTAEVRPSWLPEEFNTVEDFRKAYDEMKAKPADNQEVPDEEAGDEGDEPQDEQKTEEEVKKDLESKGVDLQDMSNRFWSNGEKLEDADYDKLEKAGYSREMVDQFAEGQRALKTLARNSAFETAGGEAEYDAMLRWAASNLTEAEVAQYNASVNTFNTAQIQSAVKGLAARYQLANGKEPQTRIEGRAPRNDTGRYNSIAEMQEDMKSPKYKSDPAFRARVERKLANSDIM